MGYVEKSLWGEVMIYIGVHPNFLYFVLFVALIIIVLLIFKYWKNKAK